MKGRISFLAIWNTSLASDINDITTKLFDGTMDCSYLTSAIPAFSTSLTYPSNATTYTDNSGWINITLSNVNQSATCHLSDSSWVEQTTAPYGNETVAFYNSNLSTAGNYSLSYQCNDSSTTVNSSFWFYIEPFKINASDMYNGTAITTFNATITGRGNYNTSDGLLETDIPLNYASTFNITISAEDYISRTYTDHIVNETLQAELYQYKLTLYVRDSVSNTSLSSFNISAPLNSFTGASGVAYIYITAGNHTVNVTAASYAEYYLNITAVAGVEENMTIYMQPYINISIRREKTDTPFQTNLTQQTKVFFYCPGTTVEQEFNVSANENSIYIPVACAWDFIKLDVIYNDTSYFRTLIPDYDERDITFYALDLTLDLGVQIILRLNDLIGEYGDGTVTIKRPISGTEQTMIEQFWDMESKATLYLLKDGYYTVTITNNEGTEARALGSLIADAAEEKLITVPTLSFYPDTLLGDEISWGWNSSLTQIKLTYEDSSDSGTDSITFTVYNSTNESNVIYTTTSASVSAISFQYVPTANITYLVCFSATHSTEGTFGDCKYFLSGAEITLSGWESEDESKFKNWACIVFLLLLIFAFGKQADWGMILVFILTAVFIKFNWMDFGTEINAAVLAVIGTITFISVLAKVLNK